MSKKKYSIVRQSQYNYKKKDAEEHTDLAINKPHYVYQNDTQVIRITTVNVHGWNKFGPNGNKNFDEMLDIINRIRPDILLLQEADIYKTSIAELKGALKGENMKLQICDFGNQQNSPNFANLGNIIAYNKNKINKIDSAKITLESGIKNIGSKCAIVMTFQINTHGGNSTKLSIVNVYLDRYDFTARTRIDQMKKILKMLENHKDELGDNIIIAGDFNAYKKDDYPQNIYENLIKTTKKIALSKKKWQFDKIANIDEHFANIMDIPERLENAGYKDAFYSIKSPSPSQSSPLALGRKEYIYLSNNFSLPILGCYFYYHAISMNFPLTTDIYIGNLKYYGEKAKSLDLTLEYEKIRKLIVKIMTNNIGENFDYSIQNVGKIKEEGLLDAAGKIVDNKLKRVFDELNRKRSEWPYDINFFDMPRNYKNSEEYSKVNDDYTCKEAKCLDPEKTIEDKTQTFAEYLIYNKLAQTMWSKSHYVNFNVQSQRPQPKNYCIPPALEIDNNSNQTPIRAIVNYFNTSDNTLLLVKAETGSGKSTLIPPAILEAGLADNRIIACTQPRQLNSESIAGFVACQMGTDLSSEKHSGIIGFKHGDKSCYSSDTKILYITEGSLAQEAIASIENFIQKYNYIIIDEVHERNLETDILLSIVKKILEYQSNTRSDKNIRNDKKIKVIIMSATFEPLDFAKYFNIDPRDYKNAIIYVAGVASKITDYIAPANYESDDYMKDTVNKAIEIHEANIAELNGDNVRDIIIFVDGEATIREMTKMFNKIAAEKIARNHNYPTFAIVELHGGTLEEDKAKAKEPDTYKELIPAGMGNNKLSSTPIPMRRIILATNTAETGITFSRAKYVIDTGYMKAGVYNPVIGSFSLIRTRVSKGNMMQRRGRVGRTKPGVFYTMYSLDACRDLREYKMSSIYIDNLEGTLLRLLKFQSAGGLYSNAKNAGINVYDLDFIEAPSINAISIYLSKLYLLGAINNQLFITPSGDLFSQFTLPPELSRALMAGINNGCTLEIAMICAVLTSAGAADLYDIQGGYEFSLNLYYDLIDLRFMSDFINYLITFRSYLRAKSTNNAKLWCQGNGINYGVAVNSEKKLVSILNTMNINNIPIISVISGGEKLTDEQATCIIKSMFCGLFMNCAKIKKNSKFVEIKPPFANTKISANIANSFFFTVDKKQIFPRNIFYYSLSLRNKSGVYEYSISGVSQFDKEWQNKIVPKFG